LEQEYDAKLSCGEKDAALNPMSIFISCSVAADIISEGMLMLVECFFLACLLYVCLCCRTKVKNYGNDAAGSVMK